MFTSFPKTHFSKLGYSNLGLKGRCADQVTQHPIRCNLIQEIGIFTELRANAAAALENNGSHDYTTFTKVECSWSFQAFLVRYNASKSIDKKSF